MISINKYATVAVVAAVLLGLAFANAEQTQQPEEKVTDAISNASGTLGTLGKKLISGARSALSHIPVIGRFASSDKGSAGTDKPNADSTTAPASEKTESQVETPKEGNVEEEAPKEEAPKEEATKEEAPKEEAPKEEAPKEEAPKEEAPKEDAPKGEAPKEEAAKEQ